VKLFRQSQAGIWPIEEITRKLRAKYGELDVTSASELLKRASKTSG
jgi:hypothetical protein